jgi:hypothetical protein
VRLGERHLVEAEPSDHAGDGGGQVVMPQADAA